MAGSTPTNARRYAQAALELALEHNELEAWRADFTLLVELWSDPDLRAYLEDVRISKQQRLDRARQTLGTRLHARPLNMLLLLISRGRTGLVPYIARQFADLERQREQTIVATVTAATELTEAQKQALTERLSRDSGKEVQLQVQIDPRILGGLIIKVGDQLLDLSVRGKLARLREQVVGRMATSRN